MTFRFGWETYAWLIYSLPFLVSAFDSRLTRVETASMVGGFAAFLVVYLAGQRIRGWRILWCVAVFDALAFAFSSRNPGAGSFFIYGAALVGPALPVRAAIITLVGQVCLGALAAGALAVPNWFPIMSVVITALVGAVNIQAAVNAARNAKLRMAHEEIERLAKVAERERIARDLHDLLGHTLSVVVLKSELAQKLLTRDAPRAAQEIADVERIARDGLREVRQAITGYRSIGFGAEVEHVRHALTSAGIDATIVVQPVTLAPEQETALSLALREAATNVIRHAGATRCHIRFYARDGSASMEVEDNGRGGDAPFGNGLTGMRERIQALGGVLKRQTDHGTRLQIELPLPLSTGR